ncbi:2-hydroxyacid dehydrogenase [Balneatrix alpica]|uniref:2-hydroxyacid dehydrogenase n=1 Tax=Balneatrix alpica TaxID=75684 RepID=A0ABV5Z7V5_9GAMM|nr:2-hydroxyacid dehydrogenase [Balneatrix alpica]
MVKVVFLDADSLDRQDLDFSTLQVEGVQLQLYPSTTAEQILPRLADAQVAIVNKVVLSAEILQALPQLQLILVSATGTNNVDLVQAKAQGIDVRNCQGYGTAAVAQHTLMLMLALATNFVRYQQAVQAGQWQQSSQFCLLDYPICELSGKKLAIVGYGELGQAVAALARAFAMEVLVCVRPGAEAKAGRIELDEALRQADFVSLHCPLTEQTRDLFDAKRLAKMKPSAFLINTARGGIVNEQALLEALQRGQLAGAATDVLSIEPPRQGNPLLGQSLPNLLITPHCAWGSRESRQRMLGQLRENLVAWQQGQSLRRLV